MQMHSVSTSVVSPLVMADRLITLAQDADRAGFRDAASGLVSLVYAVFDEQAPARRTARERPLRRR